MGKITVKHYLNTNLKPYIIDGEKYYKIYVLIRADTQNTKVRSDISTGEYTENEFEKLILDKGSEISTAIKIETAFIELIIKKLNEDKKVFTASLYSEYSAKFKMLMSQFINEHNSRNDPFYNSKKDEYLGYWCQTIIKENLFNLKGLLAVNYEINDLYLGQWFIGNIKDQIIEIYKQETKDKDSKSSEKEIIDNISLLEKKIKEFLK